MSARNRRVQVVSAVGEKPNGEDASRRVLLIMDVLLRVDHQLRPSPVSGRAPYPTARSTVKVFSCRVQLSAIAASIAARIPSSPASPVHAATTRPSAAITTVVGVPRAPNKAHTS